MQPPLLSAFYKARVSPGDSGYRTRDAMFQHTATKDVSGLTDLYSYKPEQLVDDIRVQCKSSKYPWIIQAHRFRHEMHKSVSGCDNPAGFYTQRTHLVN